MGKIKLRFMLIVLSYIEVQLKASKVIVVNEKYWKEFNSLVNDIQMEVLN